MAGQTQKGKAFEYACLIALKNSICEGQEVLVEATPAFNTARDFYNNSEGVLIDKLDKAAQAAVRLILRLEPQLENPEKNNPLYLSIQEDARGIAGDVRDIVCIRRQNNWEIGLSCKHNHAAVKHSRLSNTINFGEIWFSKSCSAQYFDEIKPLFEKLRQLRAEAVEWKDIKHKGEKIYMPLLSAFVDELQRLDVKYPLEIPSVLLKYLLGKNDFYKVITHDKKMLTQIQAYNIFGTLNRQAHSVKAETKVHQLKLPTKFFDISFKQNSNNTVIVTCDEGWALSFRIHSASTYVEPSLKFDVQLIGVPPALHSQIEPW
ncbi:MAG: HaeIII family restriction endonuclease [Hydrogenoanaerobacterium sp.]